MTPASKAKLIFTLVLCAITIAIMVGFIVYTVIIFRRIRREIRERKLAEKTEKEKLENDEGIPAIKTE